ncbi:hypothetical protein CMALT394_620012 [Carnobacterium maltaromaticum]|nr:hypothetical protein CMALT394_620012 [Carnobacterium maltaromaticum]
MDYRNRSKKKYSGSTYAGSDENSRANERLALPILSRKIGSSQKGITTFSDAFLAKLN